MSDQPEQPSPEELRAYLEQLREAEAGEILAQAYTMLGTGAEVKLGRPDARVLIDAMAGMVAGMGERAGDLAQRMQAGVAQLQMAQVEAERQGGGDSTGSGPAAGDGPPADGAGQPRPAATPPPTPPRPSPTDKLWIPGRDPGPPRPAR